MRSPSRPISRMIPLVVLMGLIGPALACAGSASTQVGGAPPADGASGTGKPARAVDPDGTASPAGAAAPSGSAPGGAPAGPAPCVPELASTSTSLFGGRVLIRLPKGVELVQQNPFYAQASAAQQATSCGAPVRFSSVGYFEWPAGANLMQVRDQLLELRGIALETATWAEEGSRGRHFTGAYTVAASAATPATRGWLVLRDAPNDKFAYFAMFETDEASWDGLRAVFQDAGRNLLVKPRAIQGPESVAPPPKKEEPPPDPPKKKKKAAAK
jgi:hypothetical protein